jgi:uncharacterized protein YkwD
VRGLLHPFVCLVVLSVCLLGAGPARAEMANVNPHTRWARYLAPEDVCRGDSQPQATSAVREHAMLCLLNWARRRAHAPVLAPSARLHRTAMLKTRSMVRCGQFSHTACGRLFTSWFDASGYLPAPAYTVGENIACGTGVYGQVRDTMLAWLNSPGHRANLLNPVYREQGLAVYDAPRFLGARDVAVWSSEFGRRS